MIDINKVRIWSVRFLQNHPLKELPYPGMLVEEVEGPGYRIPQCDPCRIPREIGGQITLTLEGRGCLKVAGNLYSCIPGTAFLYRDCDPDVSYFFPEDGKEPWRFLWINFLGTASEKLIADINSSYGYFFRSDSIRKLSAKLLSFRSRSGTLLSMSSLEGAQLVFELLELLCRQNSQETLNQNGSRLVKAVQMEISRSYDEAISNNALARKFGVSREHLSKVFHNETGQTLQEYIAEYKLSSALDLLLKSNLNCNEIARRCHYGSYSSFFRAFTRNFGRSPEEFRAHSR